MRMRWRCLGGRWVGIEFVFGGGGGGVCHVVFVSFCLSLRGVVPVVESMGFDNVARIKSKVLMLPSHARSRHNPWNRFRCLI